MGKSTHLMHSASPYIFIESRCGGMSSSLKYKVLQYYESLPLELTCNANKTITPRQVPRRDLGMTELALRGEKW